MAFATTNVRVAPGPDQSYVTTGSWTGEVGNAAGTIKVPGARLLKAVFWPNLASGGPSEVIYGTGSGVLPITVTVAEHKNTVTAGTFEITSQ